jgi:hypothetical protein
MTEEPTVVAEKASDWAAVNEIAFDFEDGLIREAGATSGDYVGADGVLYYGGRYPNLLVHTQVQGAGGLAIRLEFFGVRSFAYDHDLEASPATAIDLAGGVWEVRVLALKVVAERCHASVSTQSGLGEGPFILHA